ncbi:MAG TPA: hypothetical protein VED87_07360 [Methylocystis sp.]|nr:hypothetical protein [Methylocystis sp.]
MHRLGALTIREKQALASLASMRSLKQVSDDLVCNSSEIADLVASARKKLNAHSVAEALVIYSLHEANGAHHKLPCDAGGD